MSKPPKPKDAATLVLVRDRAEGLQILMGRRASGHSFMPDKYVFPGGKVDRCDRFVPATDELSSDDAVALRAFGTRRAPRAFALAAIRETWEETGLLVGQKTTDPIASNDTNWVRYGQSGARPNLSHLTFIGRAITPPLRHKRFDARFFLADADQALLDDRPPQDGAEMGDLRWFNPDEAMSLDLPNVTRFMIGEVIARYRYRDVTHRPAFFRWTQRGHELIRL